MPSRYDTPSRHHAAGVGLNNTPVTSLVGPPLPLGRSKGLLPSVERDLEQQGYFAGPQRRLLTRGLDVREPYSARRTLGEMVLHVITQGDLNMRVRGVQYLEEARRRCAAALA